MQINLISLVVLVLDVIALVDCWKGALDTNKKILWTVLIVLFPFLGVILYFLLAKKAAA